jgi:hypothetical protein
MSRQHEYTGETCECGHPMYTRVVKIGSRPEARRGPSCWHDECVRHVERLNAPSAGQSIERVRWAPPSTSGHCVPD